MPFTPNFQCDAATHRDRPEPASTASATDEYECYCGLGPACPLFRMMTPPQREDCTRDKRRTAQAYYRSVIG
jgi:hypothetical protein